MNIVLLSPPYRDFYFTPARIEPLGLLYLQQSLYIGGYPSLLVDCAAGRREEKEKWPADFEYLRKYYHSDKSSFSLFSAYKRLGCSPEELKSILSDSKPDVVMLSANFSAYLSEVKECAEIARSCGAVTVAGGWAITAEREAVYEACGCDYLIAGSGEDAVVPFVRFLAGELSADAVPGLIRKEGIDIYCNKPKFSPIPDYFPNRSGEYFFKGKKIHKIIVSRGCANRCAFCSIHRYGGFSRREISSVEEELAYLHSLNTEIIDIEDDNIFADKTYASELLSVLKKYAAKGMRFCAMNGMTASDLLPFIDDALDAGFIEFNMSLVSSSRSALESSSRPFGAAAISEAVAKIGGRADTIVYLIAGLRGGSKDALAADIHFLAALPVVVGISPLYSLPDINYFDETMPPHRRFMRGSALYAFYGDITREDASSAMKAARMINYVRNVSAVDPAFEENLHYFRESVKRKRWYRKTKGGWIDSFAFDIDLTGIEVLTSDRGTVSL